MASGTGEVEGDGAFVRRGGREGNDVMTGLYYIVVISCGGIVATTT